MDERRKLVWLILARLVVVSLFLASITLFNIRQPESLGDSSLHGLFRLIITTYCFSIVSLFVLRYSTRLNLVLTYAQIVWEILFVTALLLLTGGITSTYSFFYNLAIINASFLLARREALYTASLCGIVYGAMLDLHYYGKLEMLGLSADVAQQYGANYIFFFMFTNILAFFLTALLTGYLAERARRSESALQEKVIDYEELERLNSTIVSNLESGLLTVNNAGRVRVFNGYASQLIGVSLEEVYNRPLVEVIPGFKSYGDMQHNLRREEIQFDAPDGQRKIFGFKSVPFTDKDGNLVGVIIDFQDLTKLKKMEEELKRADRLAAIGELSARIAHEIRNPLASISGSVQLLAQPDNDGENDAKLVDIVLRETDRLNNLITEFLDYARPTSPRKAPLNLRSFVAELFALLATDSRFASISLLNNCPAELTAWVDHDLFRQVLWNLIVNGGEAMAGNGELSVSAKMVSAPTTGGGTQNQLELTVSDTGNGIPEEKLKSIFEPFFTTKVGGTGLGLATVYRIVESHNGTISVESAVGAGTRFIIRLPAGA